MNRLDYLKMELMETFLLIEGSFVGIIYSIIKPCNNWGMKRQTEDRKKLNKTKKRIPILRYLKKRGGGGIGAFEKGRPENIG